MRAQALLIDDEPDILDLLLMTLENMGIDCRTAETVAKATEALSEQTFDICLTDMRLPDGDGLELVKLIQQEYPQLPVAVITAHGSMELAVQALKAGAFDFVSKPLKLKVLRDLVNTALKLSKVETEDILEGLSSPSELLLGETAVILELKNKISKLARSQAPVYISGESGTGKELVARRIHQQGARASSPFIPVNCGAIPTELVESEFFGHAKGAFTGAISDKEGLFQAANGGTLFLDEIADLPLAMQVKLLRALQEKSIRPIGGTEEVLINVRILSATHSDLAGKVKEGEFREDLFYRINVIELHVPALRERVKDIALLSEYILKKLADSNNMKVPSINIDAIRCLEKYYFPGNVRELENILERALTWLDGDEILVSDLMLPEGSQVKSRIVDDKKLNLVSDNDLESHLEDQERQLITQALEASRWNRTAAAKQLGITFRALRYKLKKLNID